LGRGNSGPYGPSASSPRPDARGLSVVRAEPSRPARRLSAPETFRRRFRKDRRSARSCPELWKRYSEPLGIALNFLVSDRLAPSATKQAVIYATKYSKTTSNVLSIPYGSIGISLGGRGSAISLISVSMLLKLSSWSGPQTRLAPIGCGTKPTVLV